MEGSFARGTGTWSRCDCGLPGRRAAGTHVSIRRTGARHQVEHRGRGRPREGSGSGAIRAFSLVLVDASLVAAARPVDLSGAPGTVSSAGSPVLHALPDGRVRWVQPLSYVVSTSGVTVDVNLGGTHKVFSSSGGELESSYVGAESNVSLDDVIDVPGGVITATTDGGLFIGLSRRASVVLP